MKNLATRILTPLVLAGSLFFAGCNWNVNNLNQSNNQSALFQYKPGKISTSTLGGNYERPGGLSSYKKIFSLKNKSVITSKDSSGQDTIYFTVNPTFDSDDNFFDYPGIYNLNAPSIPVYTFPNNDAKEFAISLGSGVNSKRQGCLIPSGLSIETLALSDNSILAISNVSGKLYRIVKNSDTGKFENDESFSFYDDRLFGTTSISLDKTDNNIIYLTQIPLYKASDKSIDRPKRVLSFNIQNKSISVLPYEIPDVKILTSTSQVPQKNLTYSADDVQFGDFLNMVEDSLGNFWFADSLDRRIYKQDGTVFKELNRSPTSITVDNEGNLFVIEGTLLNPDNTLAFPPELVMISPDGTEIDLETIPTNTDFKKEFQLMD